MACTARQLAGCCQLDRRGDEQLRHGLGPEDLGDNDRGGVAVEELGVSLVLLVGVEQAAQHQFLQSDGPSGGGRGQRPAPPRIAGSNRGAGDGDSGKSRAPYTVGIVASAPTKGQGGGAGLQHGHHHCGGPCHAPQVLGIHTHRLTSG